MITEYGRKVNVYKIKEKKMSSNFSRCLLCVFTEFFHRVFSAEKAFWEKAVFIVFKVITGFSENKKALALRFFTCRRGLVEHFSAGSFFSTGEASLDRGIYFALLAYTLGEMIAMFTEMISSILSNFLYFALHLQNKSSFPKPLSASREK